jgi:hypothetical protein
MRKLSGFKWHRLAETSLKGIEDKFGCMHRTLWRAAGVNTVICRTKSGQIVEKIKLLAPYSLATICAPVNTNIPQRSA